jgi:putative transcriptional regulator
MVSLVPTHHPPAELLLDYATGASSAAEALLLATHLAVCAECRTAIRACEAIGGSLLDAMTPARLPPSLLNRTLAAIDLSDDAIASDPLPVDVRAPLRAYLDSRKTPLRTRRLPLGFRATRLPFTGTTDRVWLMTAPGGRGPLRHRHVADEWTVVLEGGFSDEDGAYAAGDFAYVEADSQHRLIAEPDEGCTCLVLVRRPPIYLTLAGRLIAPFVNL